jgi:NADPH:quinone reductase-like Zn-dependent oxidoreductase
MRAVYYERYGGPEVLQVGELPDPEPGRGEVVVRVAASALNPKDVLVRKGKFSIITRHAFPRIPGYDFAGVVERCGPGARGVRVGDAVFGMVQAWRGGTAAELVRCPVSELAPAPTGLGMIEAAAVPLAGLTALQALRDLLRVGPGKTVCLNGASGGVGLFACQIARHLGAHVVAVASSRNAELVRHHGAAEVIAHDREDAVGGGRRYDAIFDIFGSLPYAKAAPALAERGRYATAIPSLRSVTRDLATRIFGRPARLVVVRSRRRDLEQLAAWIAAGHLRPVIDRTLPLAQAADAHRYLETKRARGKVVLRVS